MSKGYTLFTIEDIEVFSFYAKDDSSALLIAIAEGLKKFKLARTGYNAHVLRMVAVVNNETNC